MRLHVRHMLFLLLAYLAGALPVFAGEPVLRLGVSSNIDPIDVAPDDLASIFLGNKRHWPDGSLIKLAVLESSEHQNRFLNLVASRSPSQYWAYWRNRVFSGRGVMPRIFGSEAELLRYLKSEKGAIGQITDIELASRSGTPIVSVEEISAL